MQRRLMYKSFDFEGKYFLAERPIGQIWVVLASNGQKSVMSTEVIFY